MTHDDMIGKSLLALGAFGGVSKTAAAGREVLHSTVLYRRIIVRISNASEVADIALKISIESMNSLCSETLEA